MNLAISEQQLRDAFAGVLLGTAVGDALGLPAENLSRRRIQRLWRGQWRMRFLFGRGMISDDTEHTLMVAQALLTHPNDAIAFQRCLAWKFRWWFAGLPGGVGLATAKATLRLWLGFPAAKAAVVSAGSGPAMRSAILGAYFADDPSRRREFVSASSRLTHRGWQAETAALAVAECVALSVRMNGQPKRSLTFEVLRSLCSENEWQAVVTQIECSLAAGHSVEELARALGLEKGVSGYALHVGPVALYAWLRHPDDFRAALLNALQCGGDTDTVGAIVGALVGTSLRDSGIPSEWRHAIFEWPRSVGFMKLLAEKLAEQKCQHKRLGPVRYCWPALVARNILFLVVMFAHGFRRLAPPY